MAVFSVAEKFVSINGEGTRSGQLAVFIRFKGCNLKCSYCDTSWANMQDTECCEMSEDEIFDYIMSTGIKNVTLTGGEPLLRDGINTLLNKLLEDTDLYVEIETNGSISIEKYAKMREFHSMRYESKLAFTMDYKLPSSDMEKFMQTSNFTYLTKNDTVKFVAGNNEDLCKALEIINTYNLTALCNVYFSPSFGKIQPSEIVDFMLENKLSGVTLQLQLHKFIWDPDKRGV